MARKQLMKQESAPQAPAVKPTEEEEETPGQGAVAAKSEEGEEGEEEEEEDEDEGEGEAKKCAAAKSLTPGDLEKSIRQLEQLAASGNTASRKDQLLKKAMASDLQKAEREELFQLLGTEKAPAQETTLSKGLRENPVVGEALDVSEYLREQHSELCKSLDALGETMAKSDARQHEFNLVLARAVADMGRLIKGLTSEVEQVASQPAHAPKSQGIPQTRALSKGFAGAPAGEGQLSKAEVLNVMDQLMEKSMSEGRNGLSTDGEDLMLAVAKYEQTGMVSPGLMASIHAQRRTAAH